MKRVPSLIQEPPGLAQWRVEHPEEEQASGVEAGRAWQRFKDSTAAYLELLQALVDRQQGLCGYCEQRLTKDDGTLVFSDYQVEHVMAKSAEAGRALDWRNLMLCCGGGTWRHHEDSTRHVPGRGADFNVSCGQSKADVDLPPSCDPRTLPWHEPLVEIGLDGHMRALPEACERAGIDPRHLDQTIDDILALNNERLRLARQHVVDNILRWFNVLLEEVLALSPNLSSEQIAATRAQLVGGRLRPDLHGHLLRFWTTERQYLGVLAEDWIRAHTGELHFDGSGSTGSSGSTGGTRATGRGADAASSVPSDDR